MKVFLFFLSVIFVQQASAIEVVNEFWEIYRDKTCEKARAQAEERALEQAKKGDNVYDGLIPQYKGRKILRFVISEQNCSVLGSLAGGRFFDYSLRVEVAQPE